MHRVRMPRRRVVVRLAVALCLAMANSTVFSAETQAMAPVPIRSALQSAWRHHPSYATTQAELAAASARREAAAQPIYNPEIELLTDKQGDERTSTAGVSLALDLSGKRRARTEVALARIDIATAQAQVRRRDFAKRWFAGLADWQAAAARVRTGERRLALMSRFADLAQKQFAADDISGLERDLALLARDEAQAEQAALLIEQAETQARFDAVGGDRQALAGIDLPSDALPLPGNGDTGIDRLPDWQVAQANALVAEREVTVARRNRIADPSVGVSGGRKDYGNVTDNVVGVSISVPLFVRNPYRAEVVAAQADADAAAADAQRVRLELEADRRRAIDSYAAARSAWSLWQASRGTDVERRASLLERLWREGELSTADYLQQLKQTLDTQLAGAELEARLWRTYTDYLASTGQLEAWAGLDGTP